MSPPSSLLAALRVTGCFLSPTFLFQQPWFVEMSSPVGGSPPLTQSTTTTPCFDYHDKQTLLLKDLFQFYECVTAHVDACALRGLKRPSDPLELECQVVVSPMRMLGTKARSSAKSSKCSNH